MTRREIKFVDNFRVDLLNYLVILKNISFLTARTKPYNYGKDLCRIHHPSEAKHYTKPLHSGKTCQQDIVEHRGDRPVGLHQQKRFRMLLGRHDIDAEVARGVGFGELLDVVGAGSGRDRLSLEVFDQIQMA